MNIESVIGFILGVCAGLVIMFLLVIKLNPGHIAQMEKEQRGCVAYLSILSTEADSLRFALSEDQPECKHWIVRTQKNETKR